MWRNLPACAELFGPALIMRYDFTSSTYTLQLTDLSNVWSESLTTEQIKKRALDDECSIDPSDDTAQLVILLQKLEASLNGLEGTSLRVTRTVSSEVELESTILLPAPLPTLYWTFRLQHRPADAIKSDFVIPLLALSCSQSQQVHELTALLKEKDAAIAKVLDKLASSQIDIHSIFPNVLRNRVKARVGKKTSDREQLALQIPGFGCFDPEQWSAGRRVAMTQHSSIRDLIDGSFGMSTKKASVEDDTRGASDINSTAAASQVQARIKLEPAQDDKETVSVAQIQPTRETPTVQRRPSQQSSQMPSPTSHTSRVVETDDEATDDEDDLNAFTSSSKTVDLAAVPRTTEFALPGQTSASQATMTRRRLGTIGRGSRSLSQSQSRSPMPPSSESAQTPEAETPRARAKTPPLQIVRPEQIPVATPPSRSRLGRIGGRNRDALDPNAETQMSPSRSTVKTSKFLSPPPLERAKLVAQTDTVQADEAATGRAVSPLAHDRRRDALKRQLEEKSKTMGKKKRKF